MRPRSPWRAPIAAATTLVVALALVACSSTPADEVAADPGATEVLEGWMPTGESPDELDGDELDGDELHEVGGDDVEVDPGASGLPNEAVVLPAATPEPTIEPAASPAATPATPAASAHPKATAHAGSLEIDLTRPVRLHATVPAHVTCRGGSTYRMATTVTVDGHDVETWVEIDAFHGAGHYRALVSMFVSSDEGMQGGEMPDVAVDIRSDRGGSLDFDYAGSRGAVAATIDWSCSP